MGEFSRWLVENLKPDRGKVFSFYEEKSMDLNRDQVMELSDLLKDVVPNAAEDLRRAGKSSVEIGFSDYVSNCVVLVKHFPGRMEFRYCVVGDKDRPVVSVDVRHGYYYDRDEGIWYTVKDEPYDSRLERELLDNSEEVARRVACYALAKRLLPFYDWSTELDEVKEALDELRDMCKDVLDKISR